MCDIYTDVIDQYYTFSVLCNLYVHSVTPYYVELP